MSNQNFRNPDTSGHTDGLFNPATVLSNIPGILGYYPEESLIFACLDMDEEAPGQAAGFTMGPLFRLDIADLGAVSDVADAIGVVDPDVVLMFVVAEQLGEQKDHLTDHLMHLTSCGGMPVMGCWWTPRIHTASTYELLFAEPQADESVFHPDSPWRGGTLGPISESQSMQAMIAEGQLPDLNREEAYSFFDTTTDYLSPMTIYRLKELVGIRAGKLQELIHSDEDMAHEARMALFRRLKESAGDDVSVEDLLADEDVLEFFGTCFSVTDMRDSLLLISYALSEHVQKVSLAVARTFDGEIRANALCAYGLASLGKVSSHRFMPAITAAALAYPGHRLTGLMGDGYSHGGSGLLIDVVYRSTMIAVADGSASSRLFVARVLMERILGGGDRRHNDYAELMSNIFSAMCAVIEFDPAGNIKAQYEDLVAAYHAENAA